MWASWRAVALVGACTAVVAFRGKGAAASDEPRQRLVEGLTRATGIALDPASVVFESGAPLALGDALQGRALLFTAPTGAQQLRDIYRAQVRVTSDGTVLSVIAVANLTRSPLGDDGPLVVERHADLQRPRRWAFVTRAFGQVQSATVVDPSVVARADARRRVTRWFERATTAPDVRWDVRLDRPSDSGAVSFAGDGSVRVTAGRASWRIDLAREQSAPADGVTVARAQEVEKPAMIWAVDTVRGLPFVGAAPITWLEETVFGLRDRWRRVAFRYLGVRPSQHAAEPVEEEAREGNTVTGPAPQADPDDAHWPPPGIAPPLGEAERNEGYWIAAAPSWLRRVDGAPPAFYRTFLRLDRERPYARLELLAMDMRQLELGMQAGVEDPVPLVGPRGDGRIPRQPGLMPRIVGAFNGAFKTEHGGYGMVVDRRVLLPPRAGGATVATFRDGSISLGTWGASEVLPEGLHSLRQNLDPLVADGVENPTRRALWGFVIGGIESMPTVRSGLCGDRHGHLVYFWGEETTGRLMARAMRLAGCDYGIHLDMNPTHASVHVLRVEDTARRDYQYQPLLHGMQSHGDRFLYYTLKDFFYLSLRDPNPAPLRGVAWETATLPEPAPRWVPSLHAVALTVEGRPVRVTSMAAGRVRFDLRAGRGEPGVSAAGALAQGSLTTLPSDQRGGLLGAFELGAARSMTMGRGVRVEGASVMAFAEEPEAGYIGLRDGSLVFGRGAPPTELRSALQVTLVRLAGENAATTDEGARARTVIAEGAGGRVFHIEAELTAAALRSLLDDLGARHAAEVTRATTTRTVHWRSGEALRDAYPSTTLFVLMGAAPSPVTRLEPRLVTGQRSEVAHAP